MGPGHRSHERRLDLPSVRQGPKGMSHHMLSLSTDRKQSGQHSDQAQSVQAVSVEGRKTKASTSLHVFHMVDGHPLLLSQGHYQGAGLKEEELGVNAHFGKRCPQAAS